MQTNRGGSVTGEESTENKSGNIFAFLDGKKKIPISPPTRCRTRVRTWKNGKEPFVPLLKKTRGASPQSRPLHQQDWKSNETAPLVWLRWLPPVSSPLPFTEAN